MTLNTVYDTQVIELALGSKDTVTVSKGLGRPDSQQTFLAGEKVSLTVSSESSSQLHSLGAYRGF